MRTPLRAIIGLLFIFIVTFTTCICPAAALDASKRKAMLQSQHYQIIVPSTFEEQHIMMYWGVMRFVWAALLTQEDTLDIIDGSCTTYQFFSAFQRVCP